MMMTMTNELILNAKAKSTRSAYASDWKQWETFCESRIETPLPGNAETLMGWVAHLVELGRAASTIDRKVAAIAYYHGQAGKVSPSDNPDLKSMLAGVKRSIGTAPKQAKAVDATVLRGMVDGLDTTKLIGIRDKALLLVGWYGGVRSDELRNFNVEDIEVRDNGLALTIRKSKTDQEGRGKRIWLPVKVGNPSACPAAALRAWLDIAAITSGSVFRGITPDGRHVLPGRLHRRSIGRVLERLDGDYSPHSLRSGFVTEAALRGATALQISAQTGQSIATVEKYIRFANPADGNAVMLLDF